MNYRNKCGYRGISAFLILLMLFIFVSCQTTPDQEAIQNKNDVSKIEFETQVKDDDETLMTGERLICTKEYENGSILSVETIIDNQLSDKDVYKRQDMAEALGVSSAFLSAVENGKKKMPEGWIEKLKSIYSFTAEQAEELQAAVIDTNDAVELNLQNATPGNRALAISFAREFDSLDDETSKKIFEILKRRKGD